MRKLRDMLVNTAHTYTLCKIITRLKKYKKRKKEKLLPSWWLFSKKNWIAWTCKWVKNDKLSLNGGTISLWLHDNRHWIETKHICIHVHV